MSLASPILAQPHASIDTLEQIRQLLKEKKYEQLCQIIKNCKEKELAFEIYQLIFGQPLPRCWKAFLKNDCLNEVLEHKQLDSIMRAANTGITDELTTHIDGLDYNGVMRQIAKNTTWCKILGYRSFLNYLHCESLRQYIVDDKDFKTHLDYTHMNMLFNLIDDDEKRAILQHLDDVIKNSAKKAKSQEDDWAVESVKYMFMKSKTMAKQLVELNCQSIISTLKEVFLNNRHFALEVLKRPDLYNFFGLNSIAAHKHPLLKSNDYQEIAKCLKEADILLSWGYSNLSTEGLKQEELKLPCIHDILHSLFSGDDSKEIIPLLLELSKPEVTTALPLQSQPTSSLSSVSPDPKKKRLQ